MRTALSGIGQWFRDAWALPWRLKGPILGVIALLLVTVCSVAIATDSAGDPKKEAARLIALSPTPEPTVATTVSITQVPPPSPTVETTVVVKEVIPSPTVVVEQVEVEVPVQVLGAEEPPASPGGGSYSYAGPYTFSGQGDKATSDFCISGSQFTVGWTTTSDSPEYALFAGFVYPSGETALYSGSFSQDEAGSDSTIVRGGPGCFYINVIAANLSSWTITVSQ